MPDNLTGVLNVALGALPSILALIRGSMPAGQPVPTDAEVIAGLHAAVQSVVQKGDAWKLAHPVSHDTNDTGE